MNHELSLNPTLQNVVLGNEDSRIRKLALVLAGVLLLAVASQISVPMIPVPLTFQSATVVLIGMAFGARYGSYIILSYLTAGICGMPVFAELSAGPHVIMGPTGGYLLGFLPAAFVSGYLAQLGFAKNSWLSFAAAITGTTILFALGLSQLSLFIGWKAAVAAGLMPFIISEPIKLIAVAIMTPKLWKKI